MGCCISTAQKQHPNCLKNQQFQLGSPLQKPNATLEAYSRSPPPVEEESVKEVLTETPISRERNTQKPIIQSQPEKIELKDLGEVISRPEVPFLMEERKTQKPIIQPQPEKFELNDLGEVTSRTEVSVLEEEREHQMHIVQPQPEKFESKEEASEVSQFSEICSLTESFSTVTTTTTATIGEKREDEATSKRGTRSSRSPSSNATRKRPYTVDSSSARERRSKSPARRAEPSPEKKSQGSSRSVRGRESGQVTTRKLNAGSAGVRRDAGENSGRRSKSPSKRMSQSKLNLNSGGRNQLKPPGGVSLQSPPAANVEENQSNGGEKIEEDKNDGAARESLENPHVSMECFIFL